MGGQGPRVREINRRFKMGRGEGRLERRGAQVVLTSNAGVASSTWVDCSTSAACRLLW